MSSPIIIFGGTGAIGSTIARRAVARGAAVHLVGRDAGRLDALAAEIGAGRSIADVTDPEAIAAAIEAAASGNGLGGLVYAVGTINLKPLSSLSTADFEADWRINALGAALAMKVEAWPRARSKG